MIYAAKLLKSNLRGFDVVVRYSADKFIAVMAQTAGKDAGLFARRVQTTIDKFRLEIEPGKLAGLDCPLEWLLIRPMEIHLKR